MTVTRAQDLDNYETGMLQIDEITAGDRVISLIDDAAIVSMALFLKGQYAQQPIEGNFRYIRTWKKCAEGWKVIGGAGVPT